MWVLEFVMDRINAWLKQVRDDDRQLLLLGAQQLQQAVALNLLIVLLALRYALMILGFGNEEREPVGILVAPSHGYLHWKSLFRLHSYPAIHPLPTTPRLT